MMAYTPPLRQVLYNMIRGPSIIDSSWGECGQIGVDTIVDMGVDHAVVETIVDSTSSSCPDQLVRDLHAIALQGLVSPSAKEFFLEREEGTR